MSSKERGEKRNKNVLLGEKKEYHTTPFSSTLSLSLSLSLLPSVDEREREERKSLKKRVVESNRSVCVCVGGGCIVV